MQRTTERGSRFGKQKTRDQVQDVKRRMEEVMQMCEQQVRARSRHTIKDKTEIIEEVEHRWHKWALVMYEQNARAESRIINSRVRNLDSR